MYKTGDKVESRRFKSFAEAHENCKSVAQSGDEHQYNIDLAKDEYVQGAFSNPTNTMWITFRH